jgi:hypothetical protein
MRAGRELRTRRVDGIRPEKAGSHGRTVMVAGREKEIESGRCLLRGKFVENVSPASWPTKWAVHRRREGAIPAGRKESSGRRSKSSFGEASRWTDEIGKIVFPAGKRGRSTSGTGCKATRYREADDDRKTEKLRDN